MITHKPGGMIAPVSCLGTNLWREKENETVPTIVNHLQNRLSQLIR
jgi:hypothetical protein